MKHNSYRPQQFTPPNLIGPINYPVHGRHRHHNCRCERVTERTVCVFCLVAPDLFGVRP